MKYQRPGVVPFSSAWGGKTVPSSGRSKTYAAHQHELGLVREDDLDLTEGTPLPALRPEAHEPVEAEVQVVVPHRAPWGPG